jgi:DNA polymerase II small subunit/DNA polymerase delta subunit B
MEEQSSQQLAADIAANVVKAAAVTTARDLQIQKLEINYQSMFEQNSKEHTSITDSLKEVTDKLDKLIDKMDGRYAKAWTEKALIWIISAAALSIVGLIVRFVITYKLY